MPPKTDAPATGDLPVPQPKPADGVAYAPSPSPDHRAATEAKTSGYVIAPGRTVDGKQPGETVELEAGDAERFIKLGFVLDDNGERHVAEKGPAVNVENGVQVKPVA